MFLNHHDHHYHNHYHPTLKLCTDLASAFDSCSCLMDIGFSARQTPPRSGCVCGEGSAAWSLKLCNKLQYHYCRIMKGCVFVVKKFTISFFCFLLTFLLFLSVFDWTVTIMMSSKTVAFLVILLFPKGLFWITLYIYDECKPLRNCCFNYCLLFQGTNSAQGSADTKFDWLYKMSKDSLIQSFFLWHSFGFFCFFLVIFF